MSKINQLTLRFLDNNPIDEKEVQKLFQKSDSSLTYDQFKNFLQPYMMEERGENTVVSCNDYSKFGSGDQINVIETAFLNQIVNLNSTLYQKVMLATATGTMNEMRRLNIQKSRLEQFASHVHNSLGPNFCQDMPWNNTREMSTQIRKSLAPKTLGAKDKCGTMLTHIPLWDTLPKKDGDKQFVLGRVDVLTELGYYDCEKHFHTLMSSYWDPLDMIEQDAYIACLKYETLMKPCDEDTFMTRIVLTPWILTPLSRYQTWTTPNDNYMKVIHRELCQLSDLDLWQSREHKTIFFLARKGEPKNRARFWKVTI